MMLKKPIFQNCVRAADVIDNLFDDIKLKDLNDIVVNMLKHTYVKRLMRFY